MRKQKSIENKKRITRKLDWKWIIGGICTFCVAIIVALIDVAAQKDTDIISAAISLLPNQSRIMDTSASQSDTSKRYITVANGERVTVYASPSTHDTPLAKPDPITGESFSAGLIKLYAGLMVTVEETDCLDLNDSEKKWTKIRIMFNRHSISGYVLPEQLSASPVRSSAREFITLTQVKIHQSNNLNKDSYILPEGAKFRILGTLSKYFGLDDDRKNRFPDYNWLSIETTISGKTITGFIDPDVYWDNRSSTTLPHDLIPAVAWGDIAF
jgi:hypothetical protein